MTNFFKQSNMKTDNPENIIKGNERVIRPRLSDAEFFFSNDLKQSPDERNKKLDNIVFHNKLGSQMERVVRITKLSEKLSKTFKISPYFLLIPGNGCSFTGTGLWFDK